jgi:23S rRNA pseudouridine1911/1915/1917 synthase
VRLDRFVRDWLGARVGRRRLAAMLEAGDVRVNGRPAPKGTLLQPGDEVAVRTLPEERRLVPVRAQIPILYVDADLVAVDKPPGMPSTGGPSPEPSVAAILLGHFPEMAAIDPWRAAGLVHRLDTGTSGLLLAARHPRAYRQLRAQFARKAIEKEYLAVVHGRLVRPGSISCSLGRDSRNRSRMIVARLGMPSTWPARTEFVPLGSVADLTLVRLRMRSGVTHQLRVHMATLGYPILGDAHYGKQMAAEAVILGAERDAKTTRGHYLHAVALRLAIDSIARELRAPFPAHWRPLFERLGWPTAASDVP